MRLRYLSHGIDRVITARTCTVNSEIFAIILFSRIALKDIFASLKIATLLRAKSLRHFVRVLCSRNFANKGRRMTVQTQILRR